MSSLFSVFFVPGNLPPHPASHISHPAVNAPHPAINTPYPANYYTQDKTRVNPVVSYVNDYRSSLTALAIYTRSPSSYTAVRDLNILQLPCIDILRKCIKKDSEAAGIDDEYLFKEHERYKAYVKSGRTAGFPEPLGTGVL